MPATHSTHRIARYSRLATTAAIASVALAAVVHAAPPRVVPVAHSDPAWNGLHLGETQFAPDGSRVAFAVRHATTKEVRYAVMDGNGHVRVSPPSTTLNFSNLYGLSFSGDIVIGLAYMPNGGSQPVRWRLDNDTVELVPTPNPTANGTIETTTRLFGINPDGSEWLAHAYFSFPDGAGWQASVWWNTVDGTSQLLHALDGVTPATAQCLSPQGGVAYSTESSGIGRPVRWTYGNPIPTPLGGLAGAESHGITRCSPDGNWLAGATIIGSGAGPGGSGSGYETGTTCATIWKPDGSAEMLPGLEPGVNYLATSASWNAEHVVGSWWTPDSSRQGYFIWQRETGMMDLMQYLSQLGTDMTDLDVDYAGFGPQISADGRRIMLFTSPNFATTPWLIVMDDDTDDDGVPDEWEIRGVPYVDHEGMARRYPLPQANPLRKNLWLEVDAMQGQALPVEFFQPVVQAFADAPVLNPDGSTGITLHIQVDQADVPPVSPMDTDTDYPFAAMDAIMNLRFGTPADHAAPDRAQRLAARKLAFRYALIADESSDETLGFARDFHADDFIVFRGHFLEGDEGLCAKCDLMQWMQSTFMHEFGHCLGLRHGGSEDVNLKPNYISTMNYLRQVPFKLNEELWRLDFSRGTMAPLNECCLSELNGFIDAKGFNIGTQTHWAGTPSYYTEGVSCHTIELPSRSIPIGGAVVTLGGAPIDFNDDGEISVTPVAADLNYYGTDSILSGSSISPCEVLEDHNDWAALKYRTVALTAILGDDTGDDEGGTAGDDRSGLRCLTVSVVQELMARMPDPAPPCVAADLNCDGLVNGADLGMLLSSWGPCTECAADLTRDGTVNGADLGAMLTAWTTG